MNESWRRLLERQGARIERIGAVDIVSSFGSPEAEAAAVASGEAVAPVSSFSVVRVEGADAGKFLHAQLTNDVASIGTSDHAVGAYCNVKGRVIASFRIFRRGEAWILAMPTPIVASVIERLKLYRVAARVEVERIDSVVAIGIVGEGAVARLITGADELSSRVGSVVSDGPLSLLRLPGPRPRVLAFGTVDAVARVWELAAESSVRCGEDAWSLLDIRGRVPFLWPETSERFLPQMLGLVEFDAVSFTKGCFPGLEVVARTQHRGEVKRVLRRARTDRAGRMPRPGTPLRALCGERELDGGTVIAAAGDGSGRIELLAVVPSAANDADRICIGEAGESELELLGPDS